MGFARDRDPLVWDHSGIGYDCTCNVEDHSRISTMCGPEVWDSCGVREGWR